MYHYIEKTLTVSYRSVKYELQPLFINKINSIQPCDTRKERKMENLCLVYSDLENRTWHRSRSDGWNPNSNWDVSPFERNSGVKSRELFTNKRGIRPVHTGFVSFRDTRTPLAGPSVRPGHRGVSTSIYTPYTPWVSVAQSERRELRRS